MRATHLSHHLAHCQRRDGSRARRENAADVTTREREEETDFSSCASVDIRVTRERSIAATLRRRWKRAFASRLCVSNELSVFAFHPLASQCHAMSHHSVTDASA